YAAALVGVLALIALLSGSDSVAKLSKAWAEGRRLAQSYPNLLPMPTASFETFKQYPGAKFLIERPTTRDWLLDFSFETDDATEKVKAYYSNLADKQGWQLAPGNDYRYYYGDHGSKHIYGYYLEFSAMEGYKLRTY